MSTTSTTSYELNKRATTGEAKSDGERAYQLLREWIITGELRPGTFLAEPELAERCGTSRTPVREALSRLAQDGWVLSFHRKGYQVRPITPKDISELYVYRRLFECYACERAATFASAEQLAGLERILELEDSPTITMTELFVTNEQFHLSLANLTANERMVGQMHLIMAYLRRLELIPPVPDTVTHREIFRAIQMTDGDRASDLMGQHIDYALQVALSSLL